MDELKKVLEELYESKTKTVLGEDDYLYFQDSDIRNKAESLCCEYLITSNGMPNYENMRKLDGYRVFAGERDSFGWLTGCVQKNGDDRILVFG